MQQRFGVKLPGLVPRMVPSYRELPSLVAEFERLGFDDVVDGEHVLFTPAMRHPGGAGDMVHERVGQRSDRADTIVQFAVMAAVTTRIGFVSGILLAAAHSFAVLARQAATLDVMSGGRFSLGVGMGWNAAEFQAQGIAPDERDARAEEVVRACRELWRPGLSEFHGTWIDFAGVVSEPAPVTVDGPPIWWGGNALRSRTSRRVVEFCQGWSSREAAGYDEIARSIEALRVECAAQGRDPETVGVRCSVTPTAYQPRGAVDELFEHVVDSARALAALGVSHFTVPLDYYRLDLPELSHLLAELRAA